MMAEYIPLRCVIIAVSYTHLDVYKRQMYRKRTILFIDEIHRFNKGQQDYLLPYVEDGTIILIGATTAVSYTHLDVYKRQF